MSKDNTIRVKELIECLSVFPQDTPVYYAENHEYVEDCVKVNHVRLVKDSLPGQAECQPYIVLSFDNDIEDFKNRQ